MADPRPGWYLDPAGTPELYRWWDGNHWTGAIGESPSAPPPGPHIMRAAAARQASWGEAGRSAVRDTDSPDQISSDHRSDHLLSDHPVASDQLATTGIDTADRSNRTHGHRAIALTIGFALLITAGLSGGFIVMHGSTGATSYSTQPRTGSQTATVRPTQTVPPMGQVDESTGRAVIDNASMTLPTTPFQIYGASVPIEGLFDIFFVSNAIVHSQYDGNQDWSATVGLAHLSTESAPDLEQLSKTVVAGILTRFFGNHPITLSNGQVHQTKVSGRTAIVIEVDVNYTIDQLSSTHDDLTVTVVSLTDRSLVAAISSIPDDAGPQIRQLAQAATNSLAIN